MDWSLFHRINDFQQRTGWAHGFMRSYAKYGVVLFAGLLLVAGLMSLRRSSRAVARSAWTAAAALIALAVNQPIANAVDRARPYAAHPNVHVLISKGTDPSFMSHHSLIAGTVAAGLCFVSWRLGLVAAVAALFMAFARANQGRVDLSQSGTSGSLLEAVSGARSGTRDLLGSMTLRRAGDVPIGDDRERHGADDPGYPIATTGVSGRAGRLRF